MLPISSLSKHAHTATPEGSQSIIARTEAYTDVRLSMRGETSSSPFAPER